MSPDLGMSAGDAIDRDGEDNKREGLGEKDCGFVLNILALKSLLSGHWKFTLDLGSD